MTERSLRSFIDEARRLLSDEAYPQAASVLLHILRRFPNHLESYVLLGQACLEQGDIREAVELFQRALSADPENVFAWVGLASAYEQDGLIEQTIWHLERAFELDSSSAGVRAELSRLYTEHQGVKDLRIKLNAAALGRIYLKGGLYQQAITEFLEAIDACSPDDPARLFLQTSLAQAYWHAGYQWEAVDKCLEVMKSLPDCLQCNLLLGEVWSRSDEPARGLERLKRAQALDPENRMAQLVFGAASPLAPAIPRLSILEDKDQGEEGDSVRESLPEWLRPEEEVSIPESSSPAGSPPEELFAETTLLEDLSREPQPAAEPALTEMLDELPDWLRPAERHEPAGESRPAVAIEHEFPSGYRFTEKEAGEGIADLSEEPMEADSGEETAHTMPAEAEVMVDPGIAEAESPSPDSIPYKDALIVEEPPDDEPEFAMPFRQESESDDLQDLVDRVIGDDRSTVVMDDEEVRAVTFQGEEEGSALPAWLTAAISVEDDSPSPEEAAAYPLERRMPPELQEMEEKTEKASEEFAFSPMTSSVEMEESGEAPEASEGEPAEPVVAEAAGVQTDVEEEEEVGEANPQGGSLALEPAGGEELPPWLEGLFTQEQGEAILPIEDLSQPSLTPAEQPIAESTEPAEQVLEEDRSSLPSWLEELRKQALTFSSSDDPEIDAFTPLQVEQKEEGIVESTHEPAPLSSQEDHALPSDDSIHSHLPDSTEEFEPGRPFEEPEQDKPEAVLGLQDTIAPEMSASMMEESYLELLATGEKPAERDDYTHQREEGEADISAELPDGPVPEPQLAQVEVEAAQDDPESRLARAREWMGQGNTEAALEEYRLLIESDQKLETLVDDLKGLTQTAGTLDAWVLLGDTYTKMGLLSEALQAYRKALGR